MHCAGYSVVCWLVMFRMMLTYGDWSDDIVLCLIMMICHSRNLQIMLNEDFVLLQSCTFGFSVWFICFKIFVLHYFFGLFLKC